jgi:hypothetical protein
LVWVLNFGRIVCALLSRLLDIRGFIDVDGSKVEDVNEEVQKGDNGCGDGRLKGEGITI